jgi:hypothetical protein
MSLGDEGKGLQQPLPEAIAEGWLVLHESGTYVKFTEVFS